MANSFELATSSKRTTSLRSPDEYSCTGILWHAETAIAETLAVYNRGGAVVERS